MSRAALVSLLLLVGIAAPLAAAEPALSAHQERGRKLFNATCIHCHGEKVWGTFALERRLGADHALLEKRTDLVGPFVKSVIRGGLGSMPAYRRTELTDADADAIVDYLTRGNSKS
jgi:mono/diheme cytochrome c family protein